MVSRANRLQALGIETGAGWSENRIKPYMGGPVTGAKLEAIIEREEESARLAKLAARQSDRSTRTRMATNHLRAAWSRDPLADQARDGLNGYRRQ